MKRVLCINGFSCPERFEVLQSGLKSMGYSLVNTGQQPVRLPDIMKGDFEFAICSGMRRQTHMARSMCKFRGIPILFVELGYMKRANSNADSDGYFQLGWDKLCWVPENAPSDRFDQLDLEVMPSRSGGKYILVASQVGGDAQHNMDAKSLDSWLSDKAWQLHKKIGKPVVWRPHPQVATTKPRTSRVFKMQNPKQVSLDIALSETCHVVTYNSTLGVEALRLGIPMLCSDKAHFSAVANSDRDTRKNYLDRLAYAQWKLPEIASGEAISYMLSQMK